MIDCAPFVKTLNGQPIAIFGLGVSGIASVKALCEAGAKVIAWDDNADRRAEAQKQGAEIKQLSAETLKPCAHLILAPGVPLHFPQPHDVVKAAHDADTEIICDMEVLHRLNHGCKTIGITGTNGKSTTTALIHHILNSCNHPNQMGGNIGRATLDLDMPEQGGVFVLEISSYQMDLCPTFKPDIAILLNITPDHLDRHGSMEGYEAAKRRIFGGQGQVQIDLPTIDDRVRICENMKGDHNLQNATAALLACEALGLSDTEILSAIQTFPGLNHRQYTVRTHGHITYINDSKATNAEAAAKSLGAYDNIYWILGGQSKEGGLNGLEPFISNVRHAFLIGEAQDEFARWFDQHGAAYTRCDTLDKATRAAHDLAVAQSDPATILLAPACASWDQFENFEARGDAFAKIVESL